MMATDPSTGELLEDEHFVPGLSGGNKYVILERLVALLRDRHRIPLLAVSRVQDGVFREERERPSGMRGGIAAPRGQSDLLPAPVLIVGLVPEGADFGAPDGSLSRVVVLSVEGRGETAAVRQRGVVDLLVERPELVSALASAETSSEARMLLREGFKARQPPAG